MTPRNRRQSRLVTGTARVAVALALLLSLFAAASGGCRHQNPDGTPTTAPAVSATQRLTQANALVKSVYSTLSNARDSGYISQARIDQHKHLFNAIDASLDTAKADLDRGNVSAAESALNQVTAAIAQLQPLLDEAARQTNGGR